MMLGAQIPKRKRKYFVHKCIKILAKRKRGNKFPMLAIRNFGQGNQERTKEETNPLGIYLRWAPILDRNGQ